MFHLSPFDNSTFDDYYFLGGLPPHARLLFDKHQHGHYSDHYKDMEIVMEKIDEYIPVTKAKSQILNIIRDIGIYDSTLAITKNGLPHAVLISIDHYTALQETIEILSDSNVIEQLRSSIRELENGDELVDLDNL